MLYNFFMTEWLNPYRVVLTEQVQVDLADFKIPCNFEYLKSIPNSHFKKMVKKVLINMPKRSY